MKWVLAEFVKNINIVWLDLLHKILDYIRLKAKTIQFF